MKTKEEILKMTKQELEEYQRHSDLDRTVMTGTYCNYCTDCTNCTNCTDCYNCKNCTDCTNCTDCKDCYLCRDLIGAEYMICNVQFTKAEYETKMKELYMNNPSILSADTPSINMYKYVKDPTGILSTLGLFVPVPISNYDSIWKNSKYGWMFTIAIGYVPLGWIMIAVSIIIKYL